MANINVVCPCVRHTAGVPHHTTMGILLVNITGEGLDADKDSVIRLHRRKTSVS